MSKFFNEYSDTPEVVNSNDAEVQSAIAGSAPATAQLLAAASLDLPDIIPSDPYLSAIFAQEANLLGGTDPYGYPLPRPIAITPGWHVVVDDTWNLADDGTKFIETTYGRFVASNNGKTLHYELLSPADHSSGDIVTDGLTLIVNSDDGDAAFATARVVIEDDAPEAYILPNTSTSITTGQGIVGESHINYGADGKSAEGFLTAKITLPNGNVVMVDLSADPVPLPGQDLDTPQPIPVVDENGDVYGGINFYHSSQTFNFEAYRPGEYTVAWIAKDAEGDTGSNNVMVVTVSEGPGYGLLDDILVAEWNLPTGTHPNADMVIKTIPAPDGCSFSANPGYGWELDPEGNWSREAAHGLLTISSDGSELTYTLLRNADHSGSEFYYMDSRAIREPLEGVLLQDADQRTYSLNGSVIILDDNPWGYSESSDTLYTIAPQDTFEGAWNVGLGADNPGKEVPLHVLLNHSDEVFEFLGKLGESVEIIIKGTTYGTLTLTDEHSFSFLAADAPAESLVISGTTKDDLGDVDFNLVELKIAGEPFLPTAPWEFEKITFDEGNLPGGQDANAAALTQKITLPFGFSVDTANWTDLGNGTFELLSPEFPEYFKFTYDSAQNLLSCSLLAPLWHSPVDAAEGSTYLSGITLIAPNGEPCESHLPVFIRDDTPAVVTLDDIDAPIVAGDIIKAQWDVAYGADGPSAYPGVQVIINFTDQHYSAQFIFLPGADPMPVMNGDTLYGWFYLSADYRFEFQTTENSVGPISFTLNVMDGDMDIAGATFTRTVFAEQAPATPWEFGMIAFNEANLPGGSAADEGLLTKALPLPDGFSVDTANWTALGGGVYEMRPQEAPEHLKFTYDGATLTCTLLAPAWNGGVETAQVYLSSPFKLVDADGNVYEAFLPVSATDDAPVLSLAPQANGVLAGETFVIKYALDYGADGAPNFAGLDVKVEFADMNHTVALGILPYDEPVLLADDTTEYGWLALFNGELHFVPTGCTGSVNFTLSAMDADMSVTAAEATVNVLPNTPPILEMQAAELINVIVPHPDYSATPWEFEKVTFDEALLREGRGDDVAGLTQHLNLPQGFTVDTANWTNLGNGVYEMYSQELPQHIKFTYDGTDLSCSLLAPVWHGNLDVAETYLNPLHLLDQSGNVYNAYLPLDILDDKPSLSLFYGHEEAVTYGQTFIGKYDLNYGADGAPNFSGIDMAISFAETGYTAELKAVPQNEAIFITDGTTEYGWLALFNGEFHFAPTAKYWGGVNFTMSATDSDLDTTFASLEITVQPAWPVPPIAESQAHSSTLSSLTGAEDSLDAYLGGTAGSHSGPASANYIFDAAGDDLQQASLSQLLLTLSS